MPRFNPPPNWPAPPEGWTPPPGWQPDPAWGPPPEGWRFWVDDAADAPGPGEQPLGEPRPVVPTPPVTFFAAVRSALRQYATFSGRARRSEFWLWVLFSVMTHVVASGIDGGEGIATLVVTLGFLLPEWAVTVRRLHDTNRSGWWILIGLVPIVNIVVLTIFCAQDSDRGENRFGPSPKYRAPVSSLVAA